MVDCFFFLRVPRLFTTNIPGKCYFPNAFGTNLTRRFFLGRHSTALESRWDSRGRTFSDYVKKWRRYRNKKPSPGRHRDFRILTNPPVRFKKTWRETLTLAIPQVELLTELYAKRNLERYSWFCAQWSILSWFWEDFVMRFGWPYDYILFP